MELSEADRNVPHARVVYHTEDSHIEDDVGFHIKVVVKVSAEVGEQLNQLCQPMFGWRDESGEEGFGTLNDYWESRTYSWDLLAFLEAIDYANKWVLGMMACRFVRETRIDDTRTVWDLLTDKRSRNAVEVAERFAVGEATDKELNATREAASMAARRYAVGSEERQASCAAANTCCPTGVARTTMVMGVSANIVSGAVTESAKTAIHAQHIGIIREMIHIKEIQPLFERYIKNLTTE